jgi:hypothetical protein
VGGVNAGDFAIAVNGCPTSATGLAPGESCAVMVSFKPTAAGVRNGSVIAMSTNANGSTTLAGTGAAIIDLTNNPDNMLAPSYDFGSVSVGSAKTTVLGANTSAFILNVRGNVGNLTSAVSAGASDFNTVTLTNVLGGPCPTDTSTVNPAVNTTWIKCWVDVTFQPINPRGAKMGTVTVTGASGPMAMGAVLGTAVGPLSVTPSPGAYGTVATGQGSPLTFTVKNNGATAIGPLTVAIGGTNAADFVRSLDGCTGVTIAGGGGMCMVTVTFTPATMAAEAAMLTVSGMVGASSTVESVDVTLGGSGGTPVALTITPPSANFGDVAAGGQSAPGNFTITNPGTGTSGTIGATLGGLNPADFTLQNNCVNGLAQLGPGQSCTLTVTFKPAATSSGARSATIAVTSGGSAAGMVTMNGNAINTLSVAPATQDFGAVGAGDAVNGGSQTFTFTNNAASILTVTASGLTAAVSGPDQHLYWAQTGNTCVATINPGATCQIMVHFAPPGNASLGAVKAQVNLTGTVNGSSVLVNASLTGTVLPDAQLVFQNITGAESRDFGGVLVGGASPTMTFTVQNTGGVATSALARTLTLAGGTTTGEFSMGGTCADNATLAPGATCTIIVTFTPAGAGARGASLSVSASPRGGMTPVITLAGTGVLSSALYVQAPNGHDLGGAFAGTAGTPVMFTLFNGTGGNVTPGFGAASTVIQKVGGTDANTRASFVVGGDGTAANGTCVVAAPVALAPNGSCTFTVTFSPPGGQASGFYAVDLNITGGGGATLGVWGRVMVDATFTITDPNGQLLFPPTGPTFDYGKVVQQQQSATATFVVKNVGERASSAAVVNLGGGNAGDYTLDPTVATYCNGAVVAVGGTCNVGIKFFPQSTGAKPATFTVMAATGGAATANITGTGATSAVIAVTPNTFDYFNIALGDTTTGTPTTASGVGTTVRDFTVTNNGATNVDTGTLTFSLTGSSDFSFVQTAAPAPANAYCTNTTVLVGGASCTLRVQFSPSSVATVNTILGVSATPGGSANVPLTGTGIISLGLAPAASPVLNANQTQVFTVTLAANAGPSGVLTAALSGTDAAMFSIVTNGCLNKSLDNTNIGGGSNTCQVTVKFVPGAATGNRAATFTVSGTTTGNSQSATLSGTQ